MNKDLSYLSSDYSMSEIKHNYGESIHILDNPKLSTLIAKISKSETEQPLLTSLVTKAYSTLFDHVLNCELPLTEQSTKTRMKEFSPKAEYSAYLYDQKSKVVVVDLARAGMLPSQLLYNELNYLLDPSYIRQDHVYASRVTDSNGVVTGTSFSGSKVGGDINDRIVFIPDPMGATGNTIVQCLNHYKDTVNGRSKKLVAIHLIITPEYISQLKSNHPDCIIYAARLDRGLSAPEILKTIPGTNQDQERGLTENQYIVPGAGGIGEVLNNSFV